MTHPSRGASAGRRLRIAPPPHTHTRTNKRLFSKPRISQDEWPPPAFRDCTSTTPQPALHPPLPLPTSTCPREPARDACDLTSTLQTGQCPSLPVALATTLRSQGSVASRLTAAPLGLPFRLHKGHGYATAWPRARKALSSMGRAGVDVGGGRAPHRGGLRAAGPVLVTRPPRRARHGALPSKPPSVTTPQSAPHSGTSEAPQRTARRPPSTAAIPFGHEGPSGLGGRRTTGALDT